MAVTNALTSLINSVVELIQSLFSGVYNIIHTFFAAFFGLFFGVFNMVGDLFKGVIDAMGGVGSFVASTYIISFPFFFFSFFLSFPGTHSCSFRSLFGHQSSSRHIFFFFFFPRSARFSNLKTFLASLEICTDQGANRQLPHYRSYFCRWFRLRSLHQPGRDSGPKGGEQRGREEEGRLSLS